MSMMKEKWFPPYRVDDVRDHPDTHVYDKHGNLCAYVRPMDGKYQARVMWEGIEARNERPLLNTRDEALAVVMALLMLDD